MRQRLAASFFTVVALGALASFIPIPLAGGPRVARADDPAPPVDEAARKEEEEARKDDAARKIAELREDVRALQTLQALALDREQVRRLRACSRTAILARIEFEAERAVALQAEAEAFRKFLSEDEKDQGFAPLTEMETGRAKGRVEELEDGYALRLEAIAAEAKTSLTPAQVAVLDAGTTEFGRVRRKDGSPLGRAEEVFQEVRTLPEPEYRKRERGIAGAALTVLGAPRDTDRAAQMDRVVEFFRRYREAPEADLAKIREEAYAALFPGVKAQSIGRKLQEAHENLHPTPGAAGLWCANKAVAKALAGLAERLGPARVPPSPAPPASPDTSKPVAPGARTAPTPPVPTDPPPHSPERDSR